MPVKQILIRLENVPGKLSEVSDHLDANRIQLLALSVAESPDTGLIRLVTSDPEKAANVLKTHGYAVSVTEVLAVAIPSHPGSLNAVLKPLRAQKINVLSLYAGLGPGENTVLILGVDRMEEAVEALKKNWIQLYGEELYSS